MLCWIPGHSGIQGNDMADSIAKEAANNNISNFKIPTSEYIKVSKNSLFSSWDNYWKESSVSRGKNYAILENSTWKVPWFYKIPVSSREFITAISRIRMGHCSVPSHLYRIGVRDDPLCDCGELGDLNHLFFGCSNNKVNIDILNERLMAIGHHMPYNIRSILACPLVETFGYLFKFIKETNLKI